MEHKVEKEWPGIDTERSRPDAVHHRPGSQREKHKARHPEQPKGRQRQCAVHPDTAAAEYQPHHGLYRTQDEKDRALLHLCQLMQFRAGGKLVSQELVEYTPNYYGTYFEVPTHTSDSKVDGLNAHWSEFIIGVKVEMFNNFYVGMSIAMKKMISQREPDNFKNLYIPGYERVYLNNTGFGFNYTLSYAIPLYKKGK